jgi:WD40 repeat protein
MRTRIYSMAILLALQTGSSNPTGKEPIRVELVRLERDGRLSLVAVGKSHLDVIAFDQRSSVEGRQFLTEGSALDGAISSDGTEIAFSLWRRKEGNLRLNYLGLTRQDGTDFRGFSEIRAPVGMCWSDDKSKLVLSARGPNQQHEPPDYSLEILDLTSKSTLKVDTRAYVTSQCWSPDGKRIVYQADDSVRTYDTENQNWLVLGKGKYPTWSPDGNWIAFLDDDTYYAIRPSGEDRKVLFKARVALTGLSWTPDCSIVAYVSSASFFEGAWKALDVGIVRLRVRRLDDNSEDWVSELSDAHVPNYQWVKTSDLGVPK